jgi:predicted nucleic acid-binding protein
VLLVLDANVIVSNPMLRGVFWDTAAEAIAGGRLRVFIPRIALKEAIAVYGRTREATAVSIRKEKRKTSEAVSKLLEVAASEALAEASRYKKLIRARCQEIGIDISSALPKPHHAELARRAIKRIRPFGDSGSGYRDALHWWSALDLAEFTWEEQDIIFVSSDVSAYGLRRDGELHLHPDLERDLEARGIDHSFEWVTSVADVDVPGVFLDEGEHDEEGPGDLGFLVLSHVLNGEPLPLDSRTTGIEDVDAIRLVNAYDPRVLSRRVRVYYSSFELHVDFEVGMTFDVVTQALLEDAQTPDLVEQAETVSVILSGFAETSGSRNDFTIVIEKVEPD